MTMLLTINGILEEYVEKGYTLTLRQLYYQLVSRGIIPNADKEYKKISKVLGEGRMAGIVDWESIEDRLRRPKKPYVVAGIDDAIVDAWRTYRTDLHEMQPDAYVEVWIEKDALSSIVSRVTDPYCIRLMVNRGYSSISAMYDASKRFLRHGMKQGKNCVILYFGDHDPSGKDMVRDIKERLSEMGVDLEVRQCALNMDQIKKYNPPPDPAKITDPRAKWYIEQYGDKSWELDALRPEVLAALVTKNVESVIDVGLHERAVKSESNDRDKIWELSQRVKDKGIDVFLNGIDREDDEDGD